jgi:adenine-specific DNA-methyltransferase
MPYLRVLLDEVFGRSNFVANVVWQKRYSRENRGSIGDAHEYVCIYARNADAFKSYSNKIPIDEKSAAVYKNSNEDPKGRWRGIPMTAQGYRPNQMYKIKTPSGVFHVPPEGRCWSTTEDKYLELLSRGRIYFCKNNDSQPSVIRYLSEVEGITPWTWWPHDECGHTDESKKEMHELFGREEAFDTPKPERLIKRVLDIATKQGDLVLDSFAGSGTTGAVAHKMGRRWIMVELGDHAVTHIVPRLKKVIDGDDKGGVTEATGWHGGGGFRFYRLAPSLLATDKWGNWVISKTYNAAMLAEAICKLMGFVYAPSQDPAEYWRHGHSSERDFLYVTTASLTHEQLRSISEDVGPERTLLICCKAFHARASDFENLTIKKIPHAVLSRCEWDRDDYSLRVAALPERDSEAVPPPEPAHAPAASKRRVRDDQPSFFNDSEA